MKRTMKKISSDPWELYPSIWKTKSAFFTYLRGGLRNLWQRFPAKLKWKSSQLISPPASYKGRAKKLGQCYYCKEMFAASSLEVDHVEQSGKCNSWEEAYQFLYKLLDCNDNWVLACKPCHKIQSHSQRLECSFEEAKVAKDVIAFMKKPKKEILAFLEENGYNSTTNAAQRKEAVAEILKRRII